MLDKAVAGLASTPSYERGLAYLEAGRVGALRASAGRVGATVQGSKDYLVELRAESGELRFSCSCPIGHEGAFCKHCVAVALAWLREHDDPAPTLDDARAHLETLPQSELVELLIDRAHDDEALARKLLLRAATPTSAKADVASLNALIDQAFAHRETPTRAYTPSSSRSTAGAGATRRRSSIPSKRSTPDRRSRATASSRPTRRRWASGRSDAARRSRCSAVWSRTRRALCGTPRYAAPAARSSCGC